MVIVFLGDSGIVCSFALEKWAILIEGNAITDGTGPICPSFSRNDVLKSSLSSSSLSPSYLKRFKHGDSISDGGASLIRALVSSSFRSILISLILLEPQSSSFLSSTFFLSIVSSFTFSSRISFVWRFLNVTFGLSGTGGLILSTRSFC